MNFIFALMLLLNPADESTGSQPIEKALAAGTKPGEPPTTVHTHLLVHSVSGRKGMSVKFIDAKPCPNVNIKIWDPKLRELKPETTLKVTGQLHFGPVSGSTPSIRYKVVDTKAKTYNDHQHWRTDKAIYIINPTYEIVEGK